MPEGSLQGGVWEVRDCYRATILWWGREEKEEKVREKGGWRREGRTGKAGNR